MGYNNKSSAQLSASVVHWQSQRIATQNESAVEVSDIYKPTQKWNTLKFLGFLYFDQFSINNEFISLREIQT